MDSRIYIGTRIKELREERGLTQAELAEKSGLLQANLARVESGKYSTGLDILGRIASSLGCRIDLIEEKYE